MSARPRSSAHSAFGAAPNGPPWVLWGLLSLLFTLAAGPVGAQDTSWWDGFPPSNAPDGVVRALIVHGDNVYCAGGFGNVAGIPARVAAWNGSAWSAVGSLSTADIEGLATFGGELVAVGNSISTGGPSMSVAILSGGNWIPFGSAYPAVNAKCAVEYNGQLVVGGSEGQVHRWTGSQWEQMGSYGHSMAIPRCLALFQGALYLGGDLGVRRWDGGAWQNLGSGLGGTGVAFGMAVHDGRLVVVGDFSTAGGDSAANVATWDGVAWSPVGSGVNARSFTALSHDGQLYVSGQFSTAGGVSAARIARWDGAAWNALGSGLTGHAFSLAAHQGQVFAGGHFDQAGGKPSAFIARWSPSIDCNGNSVADSLDISTGTSHDCDANGVPDECDIASGAPDCDGDGYPNSCEIAGGAPDCNANGVPDSCDIAAGAGDCDGDGVLNSCEIAGGAPDCDANGVPDVCHAALCEPPVFVLKWGCLHPSGLELSPGATIVNVALRTAGGGLALYTPTGVGIRFTNFSNALREVWGVGVSPQGTVYVSETLDDWIAYGDSSGNYINLFGSHGTGNGQFDNPFGVAVAPDGSVYVVDMPGGRVTRFTATGGYVSSWIVEGPTGGIEVKSDGSVYATDNGGRVRKYGPTGNLIQVFGSLGSGPGQFRNPQDIAIGPFEKIYVVDDFNSRIQIFDYAGNYLTEFGSFGSGDGQFDRPTAIDVDRDGHIYVADHDNNRVQKFYYAGGADCNGNGAPDNVDISNGLPDCNRNDRPDACDIALGYSPDNNLNQIPDECETTGVDDRSPMSLRVPVLRPNPFQSSTEVDFVLDREGAVDVGIFDVRGARIRTLSRGAFAAGEHRLDWNGCDEGGVAVPPGIYFIRVAAGGRFSMARVLRMR